MKNEKELIRKKHWLSYFERTNNMTYDQFKENYFVHYTNFKKLCQAYGFINCHMHDFFADRDADEAFMDMIKSLHYLEEAISNEKQVFSYISTTLWHRWDTEDPKFDSDIEAYYELSLTYKKKAEDLREKINTVRCDIIELYMRKKDYNMEDCYNSFYKTLDFDEYIFPIPKNFKNRSHYINGNPTDKE